MSGTGYLILTAALAASGPAVAASPDIGYDGYIAGAVATEQCGGAALSVIEEIRLSRVIRQSLGSDRSSMQISDSLAAARLAQVDCASTTVQAQVRDFSERIRPQLQSAIPLAK